MTMQEFVITILLPTIVGGVTGFIVTLYFLRRDEGR